MFGLFKKTESNGSYKFIGSFKGAQKDFLEEADIAYLNTLKKLDMKFFSKFSSRPLYIQIYHSLSLERSWVGISSHFKKTSWEMIEVDEKGNFMVHKVTTFDEVKVSKTLNLNVAEPYEELWGVTYSKELGYQVEKIKSV